MQREPGRRIEMTGSPGARDEVRALNGPPTGLDDGGETARQAAREQEQVEGRLSVLEPVRGEQG